ncbi:MAG: recombination protein RecR, partial [Oscillospiraceae bacterium]|nr:recombination protein RecR [Oscillospiraceae bacterium]
MAYNAAPLEKLIEEFAKLPGIGRKGATRLAYQILSMDANEAREFAHAIENAHAKLHRCKVCQNFTDGDVCPVCSGVARDKSMICVV